MGMILNDKKEPVAAATEWLKANPDVVGPWLAVSPPSMVVMPQRP